MKSCEHYLKNKAKVEEKLKEKFVVFAVGIEQYVEIELELMCKCECEQQNKSEEHSEKCNKHGKSPRKLF